MRWHEINENKKKSVDNNCPLMRIRVHEQLHFLDPVLKVKTKVTLKRETCTAAYSKAERFGNFSLKVEKTFAFVTCLFPSCGFLLDGNTAVFPVFSLL